MVASPQSSYLTPDQYLKFEENSPIKYEYIDGKIYAMAGASDAHVTITGNLFAILRNHVRGSGCRVYITDMKVRLENMNRFYYPDIMVTCDERDRSTANFKRFPKLIIEVLSKSTEAFDRGDKFADYRTLESLEEYILISTKRQQVESFRVNEQGLWVLQTYTPKEQNFYLNSIDFESSLDLLYEDVTL